MTTPKNTLPDTHNPDSYTSSHNRVHERGGSILGHLWASVAATLVLTVYLLRAFIR